MADNLNEIIKESIKVAKQKLGENGMDLSKLVNLTEYLETVGTDFQAQVMEKESLAKFLPFLDRESKRNLFVKIIEGELDHTYLEILAPYMEDYYYNLVEAAFVEGVLDETVLQYLPNWGENL